MPLCRTRGGVRHRIGFPSAKVLVCMVHFHDEIGRNRAEKRGLLHGVWGGVLLKMVDPLFGWQSYLNGHQKEINCFGGPIPIWRNTRLEQSRTPMFV